MDFIIFTIPGTPFAKQRPSFNRRTGAAYTPQETASFERMVGTIARQYISTPMDGPVKVTVWATFQTPQSWSKKKTAAKINRHHTQRPDIDNIQKAILDGLNRIAFADDSQVAEIHVRKVWGDTAKTVVSIGAAS